MRSGECMSICAISLFVACAALADHVVHVRVHDMDNMWGVFFLVYFECFFVLLLSHQIFSRATQRTGLYVICMRDKYVCVVCKMTTIARCQSM